ncbi:hypothetical protein [Paenibacillus gorillae]|uniref:hypothetical protein n=1 Tax=Paenibacillus gorillae TaxID=1243662 RepID=UPI0012DECEE4|nr:hypothetical protein [Paenibacillus gorillae]
MPKRNAGGPDKLFITLSLVCVQRFIYLEAFCDLSDFPHNDHLCQNRNLPPICIFQPEKRFHGASISQLPPFAARRPYFHPFADFLALPTLHTRKVAKKFLTLRTAYCVETVNRMTLKA